MRDASSPYPVGVEAIEPSRWVAWVFDHVGAHGAGETRQAALSDVPAAIRERLGWLGGSAAARAEAPIEVVVCEEHEAWTSEDDYLVNAFFTDDRRPLREDEVAEATTCLERTRAELLERVGPLSPERLAAPIPGEVQGSIAGVLRHVATAERWYHDKLGLALPRAEMPDDPREALNRVRAHTLRLLPRLVGSDATAAFRGEGWSARKIVRRTLWHERAHSRQIARYLRAP